MTTSEVVIAGLGSALTLVLGTASFFAIKWIEQVEKSLDANAVSVAKLSNELHKISVELGEIPNLVKVEMVKQIGQIRENPPAYKKLNQIEAEVQRVYLTVFNQVLPRLEAQDKNFGRIIVIEQNHAAIEKKLYTMFEAVKQLLAEKKKGQG